MFSLQDLLGSEQGSQAVDQISQNVGADSSLVNTAIQAALPALINGLANNTSTQEGAESLNNALEKDHDGSVLDNIGSLAGTIFGGQTPPSPAMNAGGILGHILGDKQDAVAEEVSHKSGISMSQVIQILMFLAPIVMGYLGRQKQQQGVGSDGLGGLLGGLLGGAGQQETQPQVQPQSSGNSILDMATNMLDSDKDGSVIDDLASMAGKYVTGK